MPKFPETLMGYNKNNLGKNYTVPVSGKRTEGPEREKHKIVLLIQVDIVLGRRKKKIGLIWFGLVWFYGISTFVGYVMPNSVFTYIKPKISKRILCRKPLRLSRQRYD